jgi:DNA topoisomerase-1
MKHWLGKLPDVETIHKLWTEGDWAVPTTQFERNKTMLAVIDTVAADLGNTRAVCRSSYIHPWFLNAWSEKRLLKTWEEFASMRRISGLSAGESTTLRVLKHLRKESR